MLNPFPIQFLSLFAYFLLRIVVGLVLIYLAHRHYMHREGLSRVLILSWFPYGRFTTWAFVWGQFIIGLLFIAGAFTQIAALLTILMSLKMLIMRNWFNHPAIPQKLFYVLLLGAATSLFFTGAGALAFDLPI